MTHDGSSVKHSSEGFSSTVTDIKPSSMIQQNSIAVFVSTIMMASIYLESTVGRGSPIPHNNLVRDILLLSPFYR